jgi:O-acetyl-ADP-ribose deacetylase (regulator of RNase III)
MAQEARIGLVEGDITALAVDAIVNAANRHLKRGGGVDGAIHRAAGPGLQAALDRIGGCATGSAVLTPGFGLKAGHVIHAVGPRWSGGAKGEDELLASCYGTSLDIAAREGFAEIAFSSISTGIYGFPIRRACRIARDQVLAFQEGHATPHRVLFCCFGGADAQTYREALAEKGITA